MRRLLIWTATITMMAVAASSTATAPAMAAACKAAVTGSGFTEAQAIASWRKVVKSRYGSKWDDFGKARNKRYSQINLPPVPWQTVTASPCD